MSTISLCMIVKNEEKVLSRCLESVHKMLDEIIIVDTGSTDTTKEIAREYTDKIYTVEWNDNFAEVRNYALKQSTMDYALVLDADEVMTEDSYERIHEFIKNRERVIGRIKCKNIFKNHSGEEVNSISWISRIIPKGVYYEGAIHEQIVSSLPRKNIEVLIHHDGYFENNKVDRNLPILLKELQRKNDDAYILYQVAKQYKLAGQYEESLEYFIQSYNNVRMEDSFRNILVVDFLYVMKEVKVFDVALDVIHLEMNSLKDYVDFHFLLGLLYMEMSIHNPNMYMKYVPLIEKSYEKCIELGDSVHHDGMEGTGTFLAYYNLGLYYELFGFKDQAINCFEQSMSYGYQKAKDRVHTLK
ncbi:glycosyltransferase family 2 protein [Priestia taiwanensis]|uniref:Glycosyltransferase 2-like domain-containing protein n=1 Tax=Priestia taiwanensis TaxID=1347902 RepID=A0A917AX92_9BACI|nr:glycosyltransferase family 2 protein [Priestia taiwanensis]MBM7364388.1 glycosyltransferase involved in cell wall biosynthesis [Priestia taiwanensis]GGE81770.1 hypothetical protein GCM10007140_34310 [Priestia taiwanensis]